MLEPTPTAAHAFDATTAVRQRRAYGLLLFTFATLGFAAGVWQVLLADMTLALVLSPGKLGLALMTGALASIPVMFLGGRFADYYGVKPAIGLGGLVLALAFLGHGFTFAFPLLVVSLLLYGAGSGIYDVGINAAAIGHERASGRRVLAYLHAAFSGGAAGGALLAGALLSADVPFRMIYPGVGALFLVAGLLAWASDTLPGPTRVTVAGPQLGRVNLYRDPAVLVLAFIAMAGYFGESSMESWSALYLRESLGVTTLIGASGVAVFHTAMLAGRLGTASILERVGRRNWLIGSGLMAVAGTGLALSTAVPAVAIAGLLLVGLSLAAVAPIAFSLAGEVAPDRAGEASAVITTIAYFGSLVAPGVIGSVAQYSNLRIALASVAVMGFMIFVLALQMRPQTRP